jgi:CRISPR-associated protein Cmr4
MSTEPNFQTHRYLLQTVDPVHIGTGGMRLGRVDNSIVREPGTRLPKIPGTSLSGAIRHYAAHRYGKRDCAGQAGHCGRPTCPICYTFGSISGDGEQQKSFAGVVSIGDARILLFPVYSMAGPVWVTSPSALEDFGIKRPKVSENNAMVASGPITHEHLNLGWLMVENEGDLELEGLPEDLPAPVRERIVLVSDKVFSQVVNSNLEVRTSVSIDPETGAAEKGALFTYEAIPRAAFLWTDVVVDDYRAAFPTYDKLETWKQGIYGHEAGDKTAFYILKKTGFLHKHNAPPKNTSDDYKREFEIARDALLGYIPKEESYYEKATLPGDKTWKKDITTDPVEGPAHVVAAGLEWAEHLGIGGMGTRGFGRIRMVG